MESRFKVPVLLGLNGLVMAAHILLAEEASTAVRRWNRIFTPVLFDLGKGLP